MSARILVCDDEADIRRLVVFSLRRRGYEVLEAAAGDAGLELALRERPDLIVLDVMLPGIDGFQVARQLREDAAMAHTPIIMLSARGQEADVSAGLQAGASVYLRKPFEPRELSAQVAALLNAPQLQP